MQTNIENKNQESINPLLTRKPYITPPLVVEYCKQSLIRGSAVVRLYITASVIANARRGKGYFERVKNIARKLNVQPALVRQAIQRQDKIYRGGSNGQRGKRYWIIKGINDNVIYS